MSQPIDPPTSPDAAAAEELPFGDAMAELEAILRRIEGEETDVDALAAELRRAARLLEVCRAKIRRAELEVTQIVQQIERRDD
jgi:exodeoxyribonuclease VII small subunit